MSRRSFPMVELMSTVDRYCQNAAWQSDHDPQVIAERQKQQSERNALIAQLTPAKKSYEQRLRERRAKPKEK